jgi:TP901 family phage tail tape measure protein
LGLAEVANLAVRINLEGNASRELTGLQKQVGGLSKGFGRAGKGIGQVGAGFARAGASIGLGLAAVGVGAAKLAIDYEDAFAGVRKTVNASEEELDALSTKFRDLATEIPIAATEFARLGEIAGALNVPVDAIDEFVEVTAKLGVTTDLTADAAADALGRIGNIAGLTADQYDNLGSALVHLGNEGASTEPEIVEIAKRFTAAGLAAGLAVPEVLGLAEAAASFTGMAPEAAGSSLGMLTDKLIKVAANGGKKFKLLNKIVGEDFRKALDEDASDALVKFLRGMKGLDKYEQANALKALGLDGRYLRQLIGGLSANVDDVETSLANADKGWNGNFLNEEAATKFNTLASKLTLLKQNFFEAGLTLADGFLPALDRSTTKLIAFLKVPGNKSELTEIGKDIGEAIDGIEWDKVLDGAKSLVTVMKRALTFATKLFELFNALPTELKAAIVGGAAINKLSGGLVGQGLGNIAGGLAQGAASRLPGVGKLFAQPVFVTNFPPGFGAGGGALGGKGGKGGRLGRFGGVGGLLMGGLAIAGWTTALGVWEDTNSKSTAQAQTAQDSLSAMLAQKPNQEAIKSSLAAVQTGINQIQANPLLALVQGEALDKLKAMEATLKAQLAATKTPGVPAHGGLAGPSGASPGTTPNPARGVPVPGGLAGPSGKPVPVTETNPQKVELGNIKNAMVTLKTNAATQSAAQRTELSNIKNAMATAKAASATQSAAQRAELGLVKNSIATMDQGARANAVAAIAAQAAGNMLSVVQSASQAVRDAGQTTATTNAGTRAATAATGAGARTSAAMGSAATRIVGAIYAARPIINVTTVNRHTTTNNRYGPTGDSSNTQRAYGNTG